MQVIAQEDVQDVQGAEQVVDLDVVATVVGHVDLDVLLHAATSV